MPLNFPSNPANGDTYIDATTGNRYTWVNAYSYWSFASSGEYVYMKGAITTVGTLATGGQNIFRINANTLNYSTTIAAGENAHATGPLSVASGITLTIQTGARVSIT